MTIHNPKLNVYKDVLSVYRIIIENEENLYTGLLILSDVCDIIKSRFLEVPYPKRNEKIWIVYNIHLYICCIFQIIFFTRLISLILFF